MAAKDRIGALSDYRARTFPYLERVGAKSLERESVE